MNRVPTLALGHLELTVTDVPRMESFYTGVLGFVVTDRGDGGQGLVFLSRHPAEHHQIVLNPSGRGAGAGPLDHFAFRVESLTALRRVHAALEGRGDGAYETVSHGTSWSIYVSDPEGNRLEIFADTPWHVAQPVRFPIDLSLGDEELTRETETRIRDRAGFGPASECASAHRRAFS
jgi:catechol-2,3-dioxygenase